MTITASQAGNSDFLPTDDQTFTLTIAKRPVTVSFASGAEITKEYESRRPSTPVVFPPWTSRGGF